MPCTLTRCGASPLGRGETFSPRSLTDQRLHEQNQVLHGHAAQGASARRFPKRELLVSETSASRESAEGRLTARDLDHSSAMRFRTRRERVAGSYALLGHKAFTASLFVLLTSLLIAPTWAQKRRQPALGGRVAIVVDERLAALREEPRLGGALVRRLGRGRLVALTGARRNADGVTFQHVAVTRRTRGWLQTESLAALSRAGDDARLLDLIRASSGFDRIERARIFLDLFPRSPHSPEVLLLQGAAAEAATVALSRTASNRFADERLPAGGAPLHSYYLNFNGLDRYRKQGITFTFDAAARRYRYDGAAWREVLRRYPRSSEAVEARQRLNSIAAR